ncbi:uncharacterized protein METZ01_LOCUS494654, partial [marine metagenome]
GIDLPGHGRSKGKLLLTIPAMAEWLMNYLDNLKVKEFSVVGHSMGSLVALETAALAQRRADNLVLVGTAFPMAVSDALLSYAKDNKPEAIDILTFMGYSNPARLGRNTNPGIWMTGSTKKLLEKSDEGVIYQDLKACAEYRSGLESAKKVSANTLLILGKKDFLTPPLKANDLIKSFNNPEVKEISDSGHTLMIESPNTVLDYLIEVL